MLFWLCMILNWLMDLEGMSSCVEWMVFLEVNMGC